MIDMEFKNNYLVFSSKGIFQENYLFVTLHKKWNFSLSISSVNVTKPQFPADLVTITAEILNEKLNFLCSVNTSDWIIK